MIKLIIILIFAPILISAAYAGMSAAPWLPTKPSQRRHLINNLALSDNDICVDLGCGDGSVLFAAARKFPNTKFIGYDISLLPLMVGWIRKVFGGKKYKNVSLRFGNLFTQNISNATVLFVFLLDKSYPKLIEKFTKELDPKTIIYVEAWPFKEIKPDETLKEEGLLPVYKYKAIALNK